MVPTKPCTTDALLTYLVALEKMINEREERTKERFVAMDQSVKSALASFDKAIAKAEAATESRFASVNEFRETLADQARGFLPRTEYLIQNQTLQDKQTATERRVGQLEDRQLGKKEGMGTIGGVFLGGVATVSTIAIIGSLILALMHH